MSDEFFPFDPSADDELPLDVDIDIDVEVVQLVDVSVIVDALNAAPFGGGLLPINPLEPALIRGVSTSELAQQVQAALLRIYPPNHGVVLVNEHDTEESPRECMLSELATQEINDDDILTVYPANPYEHPRVIGGLQQIIAVLRAPGGCPWDREQTHQSLTRFMIEEAYEVVQAIETAGPDELIEELGDVLLQILLHAQIAEENGAFTLEDVFEILASKMIRRHPHVFGDGTAASSGEVVTAWDQIKQQEHANEPDDADPSIFGAIPPALPSLARVQTMFRRAESRGLDIEQLTRRVAAELSASGETDEARIAAQLAAVGHEARSLGVDAEGALRRWTEAFEQAANQAAPETE